MDKRTTIDRTTTMDDDELLGVVEVLLDEFEIPPLKPEFVRELLTRLQELLKHETEKRPAHRPRLNDGARVALLIDAGKSRAVAIRHATAMAKRTNPKKTEAAVKRAYERHQAAKRQN